MPKLKRKNYKCCICHQVLDKHPIRLIEQRYEDENKPYAQFKKIRQYDYCSDCFKKFRHWVIKHKEVN